MSAYSARVERGAALLDARKPGWDALIHLDELNLEDCRRCVLGQLYNQNFHKGASDLFGEAVDTLNAYDYMNAPVLVEHGFSGRESVTDSFYEALTAEWRSLIESRRAAS